MEKYKLLVLTNDIPGDHLKWISPIENFHEYFNYEVVDIFKHNWYELITGSYYDFILAKPPGIKSFLKQIYDERLELLPTDIKKKIYPSITEIKIYENKRFLYQWLKVNNIPHPKTWIFVDKLEAIEFVKYVKPPLVGKTSIGASGSGVKILKNNKGIENYIRHAFSPRGASKRIGPNFNSGSLLEKLRNTFKSPSVFTKKLKIYRDAFKEKQKDFVILQEYVEHDYEWRIVVIGDSYFAHKKLKLGDKASGSLLKNYDNPPLYLFDFAKDIVDRFGFYSQAIDLFEKKDGQLLINEMQCIFGQSDPYQMLIDGKPGRYRFLNNNWIFEEGDFAKNECFDLRIKHILEMLENKL